MLALTNLTLLSIPIFSFSTIGEKIGKGLENQMIKSLKDIKRDEKLFYDFAYKKFKVLSDEEMNQIEKLEDFYLWYADTLSDIVENEENKKEKLYKYFDEIYTLVLKITTEISYIRSKNRQLSTNAA